MLSVKRRWTPTTSARRRVRHNGFVQLEPCIGDVPHTRLTSSAGSVARRERRKGRRLFQRVPVRFPFDHTRNRL